MASTGSPPSLPKPPSRAVQMELQNRISLATSRMSFLQKYRSKRPAAPTNGTAATTTTKASSFSSLTGKGRPTATGTAINNGGGGDDEDEPPLRAVADPNTGLGHAPKAAAAAATAASRKDDKLRARLVGRQQKGGSSNDKAAAKRQRNDDDSSEDDEPGRSGLGRSKKQKRQSTQQGWSHDVEDDAGGDCEPREQMQGPSPRPARAEVGLDRVQDDEKGLSGPDEIDSNTADPVKPRKRKQKKNKKKEKSPLS
ncbi:hypothetical protein PspLS_05728 [Pyricularia sp. CBS 133598]|nr:hypothetical protein PspLS_05728 [Pyricularia sp. CBS 133598]